MGGRKVNNPCYADDTMLLAENANDLKKLQKNVKEASKEAGLELNLK